MKKGTITLIIIGVILVILCGTGCSQYNGMVDADQAVQRQWGQVQNQYQRRADLIPNLVSIVKGYSEHESTTLESVTRARAGLSEAYNAAQQANTEAQAGAPENLAAFQQAQEKLQSALGIYVNAVREAYPDLKANQNFLDLQAQLEGTENRVSTERQRYNEEVEAYNKKVLRFPARIFASLFGFSSKPMFQADQQAQSAPKVEF